MSLRPARRAVEFTLPIAGSKHSSLWIHPTIPLQFNFYGRKKPLLNRAWGGVFARGAAVGDLVVLADERGQRPEEIGQAGRGPSADPAQARHSTRHRTPRGTQRGERRAT